MEKEKKILELIKKYNPDGYDHLVSGDKVIVEEHLSWLCEKYTLEQIESRERQSYNFGCIEKNEKSGL